MTKKPTLSETGSKVTEIANAASKVEGVVPRALDEMPKFVHHKGAKEIAVLTVAAREQAFTFKPVMEALKVLESGGIDWSLDYLVAHDLIDDSIRGPSFSWRDSPWRRYSSFEDFYHQELEAIWGKWEELQHTYARIVRGEISDDEGRKIVLHGHGGDRRSEQAKADQVGPHEDVSKLKPSEANTKAHWLARLDQSTEPTHHDLAAKVRAHTMTATAAAIEAGFRKKRPSRKRSRVELTKIAIEQKWTTAEARALWRWLDTRFGGRH